MKKKILAVVLAATMVLAMTMTAMAETSDVTIGNSFSANTGEESLSGDFDVTYTFHDKSNGTDNFDNFIVELRTVDEVGEVKDDSGNVTASYVYIDVRADNFGWLYAQTDGSALTFGDGAEDWAAWAAAMQAGSDCTVNVVRSGNTFTFTITAAGSTFTASVTCSDFDGQDIVLYLTGEECELTNVVFTNNTSSSNDDAATSDDDNAATDETSSASDDAADNAVTGTGDVATIVMIVAMVGAAAALVVLKKRVTE